MYIPEGLRYVHSILIAIPTDVRSEIMRLRAGSEEEQAEAERILEEELSKIEARANECYARLQAGESFDALLDEYGDDPGMKPGAENREDGYLLYEGDESYDADFMEAAFSLENPGDTTALVPTAFGYYIAEPGRVPGKYPDVYQKRDGPERLWRYDPAVEAPGGYCGV